MGLIGYFKNPNSYTSDEKLQRDLKEINEISGKGLSSLSVEEISRLFFLHERSSLSLRRYLEEKEEKNDVNLLDFKEKRTPEVTENRKEFLKNLPVFVEKKQEIIHIHTPYTFNKGMKEGFTLANYVNAKLKKKEDEGFNFKMNEKVMVTVVRVDCKEKIYHYRDCDNFETSRLINTIFEHLGESDNVGNMSFLSDFQFSNESSLYGLHIFIVPYRLKTFDGETLFKVFDIQTHN